MAELRRVIAESDGLVALGDQLTELAPVIAEQPADQAMPSIKKAEKAVGSIEGASHIKSKLSKARRALKGAQPKREKAAGLLGDGLELHAAEIAWRQQASTQLLAGLDEYDDAIKNSIGLRIQARLTVDQAEEIAGCQAIHRDISLNI